MKWYINVNCMSERDIIRDADENTIDGINIGFIISIALNQYVQQTNSYLKEINLNMSQTKVLLTLYDYDGVSIDFLTKKTYMSKSSVTKAVKHLEKKGLVNKKIDEEDNRKKVITTTDKGKEIQEDALEMNFRIEEKLKKELGNDAIKSMKIQLRDLILALDDF